MKILSRYILREYLVPLFYCLGGFISIYVLFELFGSFSRLMEAKLPFWMTVDYFCAYLAPFFEWLAPAALMLAALYTMWNFCRHSELIAMRANGVSMFAISMPILLTALAMSGAVYWVNNVYVPKRAQWAQMMKTERFILSAVEKADNIGYRNVEACRTWSIGGMSDPDGCHLVDVRVTVDRPGGGARLMNISASRADYLDGEWWFTEPQVQHFNTKGEEVATPVPELDSLKFRSFAHFEEKPSDFLLQNRRWEYNSIADRLRFLKSHTELTEKTRRKYRYDVVAKMLSPFAGLIIVLFAIPAGISSGRQSVFKGILTALGMFFAFYAVNIAGMVAADSGWIPSVPAAVLPYAVFLVLGLRAFLKQR